MTVAADVDVAAEPAALAGPWQVLARGWRVFVPVVVLEALVQALLVVADPVPEADVAFIALFLVSLVALLVGLWLVVATASAVVDGERPLRRARRRPVVVAWALAVGAVAVLASVTVPSVTPLVLLGGSFVLPAAVAPDPGGVLGRAVRPVVRAPLRWALAVLAGALLAAVSWAAALGFGFFVTGVLGALLTWLWFGAVGTFLVAWWCALYRRAAPAGA